MLAKTGLHRVALRPFARVNATRLYATPSAQGRESPRAQAHSAVSQRHIAPQSNNITAVSFALNDDQRAIQGKPPFTATASSPWCEMNDITDCGRARYYLQS